MANAVHDASIKAAQIMEANATAIALAEEKSVSHLPSPPAVPPSFREEAPTTTPTTLHQYGGA